MTDAHDTDVSFDPTALEAFLEEHLGSVETFDVAPGGEGKSNETCFVTWGDRDLVVRKPPAGATTDTAHDVLREYRVLSALQGTPVPVPETVLSSEDHSVVGSDFYVMERVFGDVIRGEEPDRFGTPAHRQRLGEEMIDTLAAIHTVDYESVGLGAGDFGYPDGYLERQVDRWTKQLEWAFGTTTDEREVPALHDVREWLEDNLPETAEPTLVHGDYKLDNVMFGPGTPPELAAVFDWEMSTLGDPLADLGWLLIHWYDDGVSEPLLPTTNPPFLAREGYPTRRELVDRYERRSDVEVHELRVYRVLAVYKEAAACEVFFARHLLGSDDPFYPQMREQVPSIAERALRMIDGDEPL
jgi:aminoglycoside phosphotransferase (APT) family kinase protein